MLGDLATQLDAGAVYDRDLPALTSALDGVRDAFSRRTHGLAHTSAGNTPSFGTS